MTSIYQSRGRGCHFALNIKFESYEVEHVVDHVEVKLPHLFSSQHYHEIPNCVVLFDGIGNHFEVVVVKRATDVYLTQGWREMGRYYGLHLGGWVQMVYVRKDRFFIEVRDRFQASPFTVGPPKIIRLGQQPTLIQDGDLIANALDQSMYVGRKPTIVFTLYMTLGALDIATAFLHVPYTFCETVFATVNNDVILVDEMGRPYPCHLMFPVSGVISEVRLRGWFSCCRDNGFTEGLNIKLEVPAENPRFVFLNLC